MLKLEHSSDLKVKQMKCTHTLTHLTTLFTPSTLLTAHHPACDCVYKKICHEFLILLLFLLFWPGLDIVFSLIFQQLSNSPPSHIDSLMNWPLIRYIWAFTVNFYVSLSHSLSFVQWELFVKQFTDEIHTHNSHLILESLKYTHFYRDNFIFCSHILFLFNIFLLFQFCLLLMLQWGHSRRVMLEWALSHCQIEFLIRPFN